MHHSALVLCCSGHDPTGGAGVQADIEACAANGARALTVITALTVQDTGNVQLVQAVPAPLLRQTLDCLLADVSPQALKFGLIGDAGQLPVLRELVLRLKQPVVLDPILRAGGGAELLSRPMAAALKEALFGLVTVLTPNAAEARWLTGCADVQAAGEQLLATGAAHVLITGGDERGDTVVNWHFSQQQAPRQFVWPRLPQAFHGAGCTLAAALAARLALGEAVPEAVAQAQAYTQVALARAQAVGQGRLLPGRQP